MIICITGKIGTGKSTVSLFFKNLGFVYIDVDKLGHKAFELNTDLIRNEFGTSDRKEVGKIVFSNSEKLRNLESLVHPT
ncbi:MAG: dephospho-CoA kinase [Fervidobacterium sp.]